MEDDTGVAPRNTPEQQGAADSEFVKLEDALMDKARNIPEGNMESRVASLTPQVELRRLTRQTKAPKRYSLTLHYLLLTDNGEPKCYEETLHVEAKVEWELLCMMR